MKTDIWMPIVIGDYLKDTRHLSTLEHGSYFLILMEMWVKGGWIPHKTLHRIALQDENLWVSEIWPNLAPFFKFDGEMISQPRLLIELGKSHKNRETASENGKLGGRPRINKTQNKPNGKPRNNPRVNPDHNPEKTSSPSPIPSPSPSPKKRVSKKFTPPTFEQVQSYIQEKSYSVNAKTFFDFFEAGNWIDSKGNSVKSWKQKIITWNSRGNQKAQPKSFAQQEGEVLEDLIKETNESYERKKQEFLRENPDGDLSS